MSPRSAGTDTTVDFDAARRELTDRIGALGPTLPGSLVSRTSRCGNRNCHCHTDPDQRHGPYWTWTRSVGGKTITRALTNEQAERYRPWFDNARRLRELVDQLKKLAIEQAETDHQCPPADPNVSTYLTHPGFGGDSVHWIPTGWLVSVV